MGVLGRRSRDAVVEGASVNLYELLPRYKRLFTGYDAAFGHGGGGWVKRPPRSEDYLAHLEGRGPGLGIGPLMTDGRVNFAAIDLDAPDFDLARSFQEWIPGASFIERSRSGNAHVWVFFREPCEAWVAVGLLKYAIHAAGAENVEVFPKQTSFDRVRLGNYINLPYHGSDRPILERRNDESETYALKDFLLIAEETLNDPTAWRKRATWLMVDDPATKTSTGEAAAFGEQRTPHMCAQYVIDGALSGERPILKGARSVVYFNLAKQLANCSLWTPQEVIETLRIVRTKSDSATGQPFKPDAELARYVRNAYEKQYTSTGCDDPVFGPYAHPDCPIANPRRP
jgi:hypothetical protein